MKVAKAIIKCLEAENIDTIFGYPGATVVPIYEELRKSNINHILVRHEQSAGHSASGFGRIKKSVGVCIATSGPGATNLITAIATAYIDSIPLVIITGQVNSYSIGKDVFQEADIIGATESFTKHSYLVKNEQDILKVLKEAFFIAKTGRPGPVLIDIPLDIQLKDINFVYPHDVNIRGYKPTVEGHKGQIKKALQKIKQSKRPIICIGGGIVSGNAEKELKEFVENFKIPLVHTLMGKDSVNISSEYYLGLIGLHGFSYANKAVSEADLLILIGTRIADRATAGSKYFAKDAEIIHIDIDPAEIGKNLGTNIPLVGHCKRVLQELINYAEPLNTNDWINHIKDMKKLVNEPPKFNNKISPKYVLNILSESLEDDVILTADVGQNQIWCARNFSTHNKRRFLTSGGLGTMGYSLPAAIGAKIASNDKTVVAVMGDGSFQMSLTELGTIADNNIKIIILLFNNSGLGMVREIQKNNYGNYHGVEFNSNPDFIKIAEAYNLKGKRIYKNKDFKETFEKALRCETTFLIECIVDPKESTF